MAKILIWHPESDSYFIGDHSDLAKDGLLSDVTGIDEHEIEAAIAGVDVSDLSPDLPGKDQRVGLAGAIAASMAKWARKPADLYPTPPDCVWSLQPLIEDLIPRGSAILEPACADGQMVRALEQCGYEVDGFDLRPDVTGGIGSTDFLDVANFYHSNRQYAAVWTNPPFVVADAFIRRALDIAPVAVMLLKSNFWNTKNRRKLWREKRPTRIYSLTWRPAFLEEERGKSPLMDCIWAVFERGKHDHCEMEIIEDRLLAPPMDFGGL